MRRLLLATIFLAGAISSAMAIDFTQTIKTFDGKEFVDANGAAAPQVLSTITENSLLQTAQTDTVEEKNKRFWLALKIHDTPKEPKLSAEELATIKKAIGTYQPIAIMGQAFRLLDPDSVPKN
jgi:hypothetical protein